MCRKSLFWIYPKRSPLTSAPSVMTDRSSFRYTISVVAVLL